MLCVLVPFVITPHFAVDFGALYDTRGVRGTGITSVSRMQTLSRTPIDTITRSHFLIQTTPR